MHSATRILIVGATARAAAGSARRAGFEVDASDLFGDLDLRSAARDETDAYRAALRGLVVPRPDRPVLYTGSLESEPVALRALESGGTLLGNPADVVGPVRDPIRLARALRDADLPTPDVTLDIESLPADGTWLLKHPCSSGGLAVFPYVSRPLGAGFYAQRRVDGRRRSALYLGDARGVALIGLAAVWSGAAGRPYAYRGGLAPLPIAPRLRAILERLGRALHEVFGLRGLFGVDLIVRDGVPWVLEVNPRYTASVELYEHATGRALLAEHARAFGVEPPPGPPAPREPRPACVGKLIVYTREALRWSGPAALRSMSDPWRLPRHADIPATPGMPFHPNDPVLTLLEAGDGPAVVARRLRRRMLRWRRRLAALAQAFT
jgi:predicted ATP-grasp superfamily ATP-dependent carboligase